MRENEKKLGKTRYTDLAKFGEDVLEFGGARRKRHATDPKVTAVGVCAGAGRRRTRSRRRRRRHRRRRRRRPSRRRRRCGRRWAGAFLLFC